MPEEIKMLFKAIGVFTCIFSFLALFVYVKYQIPKNREMQKNIEAKITQEDISMALACI